MSTILTINTKDPETRVIFGQPLCSISEIQLVDYDFPDTYEIFETNQTIKKFGESSSLFSTSAGNYSLKMLITAIIFNNSGVEIQLSSDGYNLITNNDDVIFSGELSTKLGVPSFLPAKKSFPFHGLPINTISIATLALQAVCSVKVPLRRRLKGELNI